MWLIVDYNKQIQFGWMLDARMIRSILVWNIQIKSIDVSYLLPTNNVPQLTSLVKRANNLNAHRFRKHRTLFYIWKRRLNEAYDVRGFWIKYRVVITFGFIFWQQPPLNNLHTFPIQFELCTRFYSLLLVHCTLYTLKMEYGAVWPTQTFNLLSFF